MASKRKRRTSVHTNLRLPTALHRELRRAAKGKHTSIHAEILRRLGADWDEFRRIEWMWLLTTIRRIGEVLDGQQAQTRPPAQNGPAPQERAPQADHG